MIKWYAGMAVKDDHWSGRPTEPVPVSTIEEFRVLPPHWRAYRTVNVLKLLGLFQTGDDFAPRELTDAEIVAALLINGEI